RNNDAKKADSDMRLEGTWTLPAGKVRYGETLFEAAKRKAKGEVNLDVDGFDIVSLANDINDYAHFLTVGLLANSWKGEISLGDTEEHVDFGFFAMDNLPENLCEPSKKILRNYQDEQLYREEK
ncbi:MAG: NUDIX hydrolase, partial [Bacilli bacterium]|nr:NUDIX hydrolase [Bacilli bacterium]